MYVCVCVCVCIYIYIYIYIYISQVNEDSEYLKNECLIYLIQNIPAEQNIYFLFKRHGVQFLYFLINK